MSGLRKSLLPSNVVPPAAAPLRPEDEPAAATSPLPPAVSGASAPAAGGEVPPNVSISNEDLGRTFRPTEAQVRVKARYWAAVSERPLVNGAKHTLALAQQLTQSAQLETWARRAGFKEWFFNEQAMPERLEWLQELALNSLEDLLLNTDPRAQGARLNAAKLVAEMTGRARKAGPDSDDEKRKKAVDKMDREELTKFLASQGIHIQQVVAVDAAAAEPKPKKD